MLQNLHTHTTLCDGKNTPRQMARAAYGFGFNSLGFSGHAKTILNTSWEMKSPNEYIEAIEKLKDEYLGKLDIFVGLELDRYSEGLVPYEKLDYAIGSVHMKLMPDGRIIDYDRSLKATKECIDEIYGGSSLAFVKDYYEMVAELPRFIDYDIVGHFDLLTKFSETDPALIDTKSKEYRSAAIEALHELRKKRDFFEVNTGAMSRGYRTTPYPDDFILDEMRRLDCKLILTSDCHDADHLCYKFDESREYIRSHKFDTLYYLTDKGFVGQKI